jgi:excisionase family DNA binding protein
MTASNETLQLSDVYTFDEAAAKLRVSRQTMTTLIRRHPHFSKCGRVYRFSEADILAIWDAIRSEKEPATALGRSSSKRHPRPRNLTSADLRLLTGKPRKRTE